MDKRKIAQALVKLARELVAKKSPKDVEKLLSQALHDPKLQNQAFRKEYRKVFQKYWTDWDENDVYEFLDDEEIIDDTLAEQEMDAQTVDKFGNELEKLIKKHLRNASGRQAAIVYTLHPFNTYGGQMTNAHAVEKKVNEIVQKERFDIDITSRIMNMLRKKAGDLEAGKKLSLNFSVPIFIYKDRDDIVRVQFQT